MLSYPENIPQILKIVNHVNPLSVLDIGCGFGKYGMLIREQHMSNAASAGDMKPESKILIDAVEDTRYFHENGIISHIYDTVYDTDALSFVRGWSGEKYDLVLLIDVVEHWTKQYALEVFSGIGSVAKSVLVSTPISVVMYKDHFYGDPRHHITQFNKESMAENGFSSYVAMHNQRSYIWLVSA